MNYKQIERIERMYRQPLFLIDFQSQTQDETHPLYVFKVAGSTANLYTVVIDEEAEIHCDCPDSRSWAVISDCKCKHCCFVWIKALGQPSETINVPLNDTEKNTILEACQQLVIRHELTNEQYREKYKKIKTGDEPETTSKKADKFTVTKQLDEDDDCPVCFESLNDEKLECQQCPTCNNVIHVRCMKKWLAVGNKTCVYCRSKVWVEIAPAKRKTNSKYLNLADH